MNRTLAITDIVRLSMVEASSKILESILYFLRSSAPFDEKSSS